MHTRLSPLILGLLSLLLASCIPSTPNGNGGASSSAATVDAADKEEVAEAILDALAEEDWTELSEYVSDDGVRFTPYTHISAVTDQTFEANDVAGFGSDQTVYNWGTTEGAGEPIEMTVAEYMDRYVWGDHDYRTADLVRWNHEQDNGSMIDNAADVYPTAEIVEYHFEGFDPQYGGMDWRSLRLVLVQDESNEWKLRGVIHDEWTP